MKFGPLQALPQIFSRRTCETPAAPSRAGIASVGRGVAVLAVAVVSSAGAAEPEQILAFKPEQPGVDVQMPPAAQVKDCKVTTVKVGAEGSGYVMTDPNGLVLRRFEDSTGDKKLDRYRYYKDGMEVYRDIDSNADEVADQFRWFANNGSRWGVDENGDKKIDRWQVISAEEATREAVRAIAEGDVAGMAAVLLTPADAKALGLSREMAEALVVPPQQIGPQMKAATQAVTRGSRWTRFDATPPMPATVPAESGKAKQDISLYGNGIISIDTGGKPNFLIAGEVVRVGDAWKLTSVPTPNTGDPITVVGLLSPPLSSVGGEGIGMTGLTPQQQEVLKKLEDLREPPASSDREALIKFNQTRAQYLRRLIEVSPEDESEGWYAELIDTIADGARGNAYPNGAAELKQIEDLVSGDLKARANYRRLIIEYYRRVQEVDPTKQAPVNEWFMDSLQKFVRAFPESPDSAEALYQLASSSELAGNLKDAATWYAATSKSFPETPPAMRAEGALRRLNLKGKPFTLAGQTMDGRTVDLSKYRGKVVAVVYWASWSPETNNSIEALKRIYSTYSRNGFEVVGVNLDLDPAAAAAFVKDNQVPWPSIATQGAYNSPEAVSLGLISSHVLLLDKAGNVVDTDANMQELQNVVPRLLLAD